MTAAESALTPSKPWREALFWAVFLSVLFLVVYGLCNIITAHRSGIGASYFAWELHIPFVPILVVPYLSIDILFFIAPFLCADQIELRGHAKRVAMAILVAAACFLLFPLKAGFARPQVEGVWGATMAWFWKSDKPYNLAPSLHIALWVILWVIYVRHTRGWIRASLAIWFVLIGISTVFTHQHQVIDLITGYLLAMFCLAVFPLMPARRFRPTSGTLRIAARYALGAVILILIALALHPRLIILQWPIFTLACMSAAYCGIGAGIFRKTQGRLPLDSRVFMGPFLLGAWLWLICNRGRLRPWDRVTPGLFIGRKLTNREGRQLIAEIGVTAVLDLTAEYSETASLGGLEYKNIAILDLTPPRQDQLREAVEFIQSHMSAGVVFVHCVAGYSRSVCVAAAYLLKTRQAASAENALAIAHDARGGSHVSAEMLAALREFANG